MLNDTACNVYDI